MGARGIEKSKKVTKERLRTKPAISQEAKENRLIGLAMDLVEQRLIDGTATSQEVCHFLKLGSIRERKEMEILEKKKDLIEAKTENYQTAKHIEELYTEAINAMRKYSGHYEDIEEIDE